MGPLARPCPDEGKDQPQVFVNESVLPETSTRGEFVDVSVIVYNIILVGGLNPSERYESRLG